MVITGPANRGKSGIVALDGFVRTDWLPYPFTMSWRLTEANRAIRFEQGQPIGRIFPYPLGMLEKCELQVAEFDDDPELKTAFIEWTKTRAQSCLEQKKSLDQHGTTADLERDHLWKKRYARGEGSAEVGVELQTVFRCRELAEPLPDKPKKTNSE